MLKQPGDAEFEVSRTAAEKAYKAVLEGIDNKKGAVKLALTTVEYLTAEKHVSPQIAKLPEQWAKDHDIRQVEEAGVIRYKGASESHVSHSQGALRLFDLFFKERHPGVAKMAAVTKEQVRSFLDGIEAEQLSGRIWNYYLILLREMFNRHESDSSACKYSQGLKLKAEETTHRKPFTEEQLRAIFIASQKDDFIRPVVVLGLNTPLRLGDCCQLKWSAVDPEEGFLTVPSTSKTQKEVQIPIWGQLKAELVKHPRTGEYVLPKQAQMYRENPTGINSKLREVFAAAGIPVFEREQKGGNNDAKGQDEKTGKLEEIGSPPRTINAVAQGSAKNKPAKEDKKADEHKQTAKGPRSINEQAFQAFRVTWVTRALNRGVPLSIVRIATAHTTVEIVLKHYYKPAKEHMRDSLAVAEPALGSRPAKRPEKAIVETLHKMTSKTWQRDRAKLIRLCELLWPSKHLRNLDDGDKPRGHAKGNPAY